MIAWKKHCCLLILLFTGCYFRVASAQIRSRSLDLGIDGSFYTAPLVISLGGNSIGGGLKRVNVNGQMGVFVFENFAIGGRYFKDYEYFWVERQHFNSNTGQYEPYKQINNSYIFGGYGRYYFDLANFLSVFTHAELGVGKETTSYTREDGQGGVETISFEKDLSDLGLSLGIAIRPAPQIGIEIQAMRRFLLESYDPGIAGSTLLQTESYQGYEFRIGARINVDLIGALKSRNAVKLRPF